MACTIRNPSPASLIFKSETKTSKVDSVISPNASGTVEAIFTSNPLSWRMGGKVRRMLGSSSTNRSRLRGPILRLPGIGDSGESELMIPHKFRKRYKNCAQFGEKSTRFCAAPNTRMAGLARLLDYLRDAGKSYRTPMRARIGGPCVIIGATTDGVSATAYRRLRRFSAATYPTSPPRNCRPAYRSMT
jgi:hypothetical protein